MKALKIVALLATFSLTTACSMKSKTPSSSGGSTGPAMKAEGNAANATTSEAELLERYNVVELNTVANALRVLFDKSIDPKPEATPAEPILDCQISGDAAKKMLNPLRALIDTQTEHERETYTIDPSVYSRSNGLETCGAKCACGALATVLKPVSNKSFKSPSQRVAHDRALKRLQAKASRQTAEESLSCARKVSWFCSSDLRSYLEKQAGAL